MHPDADDQDLHELRPAPGVLLRHRGADLDVHVAARGGPRIDLRRGALWIRATRGGVGVTVTHGAVSIHLGEGAVVVEVHEVEALVLVASGRAVIKASGPLPRTVSAGQAVALTIDGTASEPDRLAAVELANDRMVVENLARDLLASRPPDPPADPVADAPEVQPDPPRTLAKPELVLRSEVVAVRTEPSALETALANVGVGTPPPPPDDRRPNGDPIGAILDGPHHEHGTLVVEPEEPVESDDEAPPADLEPDDAAEGADDDGASGATADASRRRKIIALIVVAMILFAVIAAVVLSASG